MRINIYLIRHGEAQDNIDRNHLGESSLTQLDYTQAIKLSEKLKDLRIKKIYASPLLRARQTAEKTCIIKNIEVRILENAHERNVSQEKSSQGKEHESYIDFIRRVESTLENFQDEEEVRHIALFSHAIFIKGLLLRIILEEGLTEGIFERALPLIAIDHARVSKIVYNTEKDKWHVSFVNNELI